MCIKTSTNLRIADAFMIGLAQSLALITGTSRSDATIIGGLLILATWQWGLVDWSNP